MNNTIRIGFIDMLTAFLCSSAVLMVIIAYSRNESGDIAGTPRNYIYYKLKIEDVDGNNRFFENAKLRIMLEDPDGRVLETLLSSNGIEYGKNGFMQLNADTDIIKESFYAWGPSVEFNKESDSYETSSYVFNIYGTTPRELRSGSKWKMGVLYYDHKELGTNAFQKFSGSNLEDIVETRIKLVHQVSTKDSTSAPIEEIITLGEFSSITI